VNREYGTTMLLTTHDLSDIEELCQRLMIIDHGKLLFDGGLSGLKAKLWQESAIKVDLRDREQAATLAALTLPGVVLHKVDELSYRLQFHRAQIAPAEVIREVVNRVEVQDIAIEEQSIEDVVRRIYSGEALPTEGNSVASPVR
jgi:ABC-2 type transport system ATP-binding protein